MESSTSMWQQQAFREDSGYSWQVIVPVFKSTFLRSKILSLIINIIVLTEHEYICTHTGLTWSFWLYFKHCWLVVGHWFHSQNRLSEAQMDLIIEVTPVSLLVKIVWWGQVRALLEANWTSHKCLASADRTHSMKTQAYALIVVHPLYQDLRSKYEW